MFVGKTRPPSVRVHLSPPYGVYPAYRYVQFLCISVQSIAGNGAKHLITLMYLITSHRMQWGQGDRGREASDDWLILKLQTHESGQCDLHCGQPRANIGTLVTSLIEGRRTELVGNDCGRCVRVRIIPDWCRVKSRQPRYRVIFAVR